MKMKVIQIDQYGDANVLKLVQIATPGIEIGKIRIRVRNISVNPVDWKTRAGLFSKFYQINFPAILGRDGSGTVTEIADDVSSFKVGDEVCFMMPRGEGCYAEEIVIPEEFAVLKPINISFSEAASYPLVAVTSWMAFEDKYTGGLRDKHLLIHGGAGGIGSVAIPIAKYLGAFVSTTCSSSNVNYVTSLGADKVIAYDKKNFVNELEDVDIVYDTMGGNVHRLSYDVIKPGGYISCLNALPFEDLSESHNVSVNIVQVDNIHDPLVQVSNLISKKVFSPQVFKIMSFNDVSKAHRLLETGHARGKIILET
jgi:NADPH:quinone reductase-like Zn-dependent oxidoreductase